MMTNMSRYMLRNLAYIHYTCHIRLLITNKTLKHILVFISLSKKGD
jgi:hypothetical protein